MVKISERLRTAAGLVGDGNRLADVGTDHGYVPIYLLQQGRIPKAVAMDINRGPLERAREHIRLYGMENYIETRLSDGVEELAAGEVDSILIAGMGGGLVVHILTAGETVCRSVRELVLQPQSELFSVRSFLRENGYIVDAEEMVEEDGKYYPMMRVHYDSQTRGNPPEDPEVFCLYGGLLLCNRHPVLREYLLRERTIQQGILKKLHTQTPSEQVLSRICEVEHILVQNEKALSYYR